MSSSSSSTSKEYNDTLSPAISLVYCYQRLVSICFLFQFAVVGLPLLTKATLAILDALTHGFGMAALGTTALLTLLGRKQIRYLSYKEAEYRMVIRRNELRLPAFSLFVSTLVFRYAIPPSLLLFELPFHRLVRSFSVLSIFKSWIVVALLEIAVLSRYVGPISYCKSYPSISF
jgi:hypothetical protein